MNRLQNDRGQSITAIGAPGSLERVKAQWPGFIDQTAYEILRRGMRGIEVDSVLEAIAQRIAESITTAIQAPKRAENLRTTAERKE